MFFDKYFERWKLFLGFMTGVCGVIYFVVFQPLSVNLNEVEDKLKLEKSKIVLNSRYGFSATEIRGSFLSARDENRELDKSLLEFTSLFSFSSETNDKINEDFQNTEFELYRFNLINDYISRVGESNVIISANLDTTFPAFSGSAERPGLLWGHIDIFKQVFDVIFITGNIEVLEVEAPPVGRPVLNELNHAWHALPVKLKLKGDGDRIIRFLELVTLSKEYLKKRFDIDAESKPGITIESAMIKRVSQEPTRIELTCQINGFVRAATPVIEEQP